MGGWALCEGCADLNMSAHVLVMVCDGMCCGTCVEDMREEQPSVAELPVRCLFTQYGGYLQLVNNAPTSPPVPTPSAPSLLSCPPPPPVQAALVRSEGVLRRRLQELSHDLSDASLQQVRG